MPETSSEPPGRRPAGVKRFTPRVQVSRGSGVRVYTGLGAGRPGEVLSAVIWWGQACIRRRAEAIAFCVEINMRIVPFHGSTGHLLRVGRDD